ncbi:unnamed protein product [Parnassius apollo]|uniref:(apollo) hypothetical protein n=1 Tax=Parnassius apollo TaxID=110799 RepID=A0A8S3XIH5_PARAO|nr:unnamed protein product [Parnassius apollo]
MRAVVFLFVLNALSTLPSLNSQKIANKRRYSLYTPEKLENTKVRSLPTAPVTLYKYPYNSINSYVTAPNSNHNVIPQNNYVKNKKLMRLKLFYEILAKKRNKKFFRKNKNPTLNYKLADRNIHRTSIVQNPSHIQNYIINKGHNTNLIGSRRTKLDDPTTKYRNNEKTYELNEDGRNYYKKPMYLMSDPERSNFESKSLINFKNESSEHNNNLEPLDIHESSVRRSEPSNLIDQYYVNEDSTDAPFEVSDTVLNNEEYYLLDLDASKRSFAFKPPFGLLHPIKDLTNKIKTPLPNHMKFKPYLTHYSLNNLLVPQNDNNELQLIKTYLTELMRGENYNNPNIIQILYDANELDLSNLDLLDQSQLVKLSETDLQYLKRYFVLILNKYGLTPYILKLLEYINLIEGKPKNETYLLFKILTNQQAVNNLSPVELSQIKQHLQHILNEYGQSPYILPFVQNIKGINIDPISNKNILFLDVNNHGNSDYVTQEDMTRIFLYLIQSYRNNPLVLKIIQNLNETYENPNHEMAIPFLDISYYQSLAFLNQNDLDLFVKYILQIIKRRGENWYLNRLLFYINQLRGSFNKGINVTLVYDNKKFFQKNQKELDLTKLYKLLLQFNNTNGVNQEIFQFFGPFTNKKQNEDKAQRPVNLSADHLAELKNIFLQIKNKNKVNSILVDIPQILNQPEKKQVQHHDLQPQVLDSKNTIDMNLHDMEQIYNYLQNMNNVKDNFHIVKILQLIKQTQNQNNFKDKNGIIKIKHNDLAELYNFLLQLQKEDTGNSIFKKILQYINHNKDNVLNTNNNSSQSQENINPKDLDVIYSKLQKLKENNESSTELLQYMVYGKNVQKYEPKLNVLSYATSDALDRIKKFLLTLMKEQGEIPYVFQILLDINRVQGIPEIKNNKHLFLVDDTVAEVNEDDLQILSKYLTKIISEAGESADVLKILEYVYEAHEKIKAEKETQNKQNPIDSYILQIINNRYISPELVNILRYINSDNWNNLLKKIENLKEDDLNVLSMYLQQIITHFGASSRIKVILAYINKINKNAKHRNDNLIIYFNNTHLKDNDKQNQTTFKITRENLIMINKDLFDLLKRYGINSNALRILYEINHITEGPNKEMNTLKLITNTDINDTDMKFEDFKAINSYILQLINKRGVNSYLLKILGDINQIYGDPTNYINTSILKVNNTHIVAIVDSNDINRIKSNLIDLSNYYGLKPYIRKILNNINSDYNNPNVYSFIRLDQNNVKQLTQFLLQLMEKHGAFSKFVEILKFIYQIYGDIDKETKSDDAKEQHMLEITKEINMLLEHGVMQFIKNIEIDNLNTLYNSILQNIFISPNTLGNNDLPSILARLIVSYKQEVSPVNKYILLKLYEYILKNDGVPFETFWKPSFINVLLDLNVMEQNKDRPYTIHEDVNGVFNILSSDRELQRMIHGYLNENTDAKVQPGTKVEQFVPKICPASEILIQIQEILTKFLNEDRETFKESSNLNEVNIQKDDALITNGQPAENYDKHENLVIPILEKKALRDLLKNGKLKTKLTVQYELPGIEDINCKQALSKILKILKTANLYGNNNILPSTINHGNNNAPNTLFTLLNSQKSLKSPQDIDILKNQISKELKDKILSVPRDYGETEKLNDVNGGENPKLDQIFQNEKLINSNSRPDNDLSFRFSEWYKTVTSDGEIVPSLPPRNKVFNNTEGNALNDQETVDMNQILNKLPMDDNAKLQNQHNIPSNAENLFNIYLNDNAKNSLTDVLSPLESGNNKNKDNAKLQNQHNIPSNAENLFNIYLSGNAKNSFTDVLSALESGNNNGNLAAKNKILAYLMLSKFQNNQPLQKLLMASQNMKYPYLQAYNINPNLSPLNQIAYHYPNEASTNNVYQLPYNMGNNKYYKNIGNTEPTHGNGNFVNQNSKHANIVSNGDSVYQTSYINANPYSVSKLFSYGNNVNQQLNAPNNLPNLQRVIGMSNFVKLNSAPDSASVVELTYVLRQPNLVAYQPTYFVKYRLPYEYFIHNFRDLLQRKPHLRTEPDKLYQELLNSSNVAEVSPNLKGVGKQELLSLVTNNGALVKTEVVAVDEALLDKQLRAIQNINSKLTPTEIVNNSYTMEPTRSLDNKYHYLNTEFIHVGSLNENKTDKTENMVFLPPHPLKA